MAYISVSGLGTDIISNPHNYPLESWLSRFKEYI